MTRSEHPITPPPELVQQWYNECPEANEASLPYIATQAARWGADQELEACVEWLISHGWFGSSNHDAIRGLRAARRPKSTISKEECRAALQRIKCFLPDYSREVDLTYLERALEALPDDPA